MWLSDNARRNRGKRSQRIAGASESLPILQAMKTETQAEKRKSISELHRSRYKRNSISKTNEESRRRRVAIDQALRRKHREQLITAKRFRHLTQKEEYESAGEDDG